MKHTDWQIKTLGQVSIEQAGVGLKLPLKARALLVYLAVTGKSHSRELLSGLLWGEMPDAAARANLRVTLNKLRQATGDWLLTDWQEVGLNPAVPLWLDGAALAAAANQPPATWPNAITLYQGDFLADFYLPDAPAFDEWAALERERLRQIITQLLNRLIRQALEQQSGEVGITYARRLLVLDNWREEAHRDLMRLLALNGQRSEALAQFDLCRRLLAEELGVEPSPETVKLYEEIVAGSWPLVAGSEQLATGAEKNTAVAHNLPAAATSFVGREKEMVQLADLLARPDGRLITLLGPGGVGKTRLALHAAAHQLSNPAFADGVTLIPLAAIHPRRVENPVVLALAEGLGLKLAGSQPVEGQLLAHLRPQKRLLILDNCEHLLEHLVFCADILAQAPGVRLLITSRERLGLYEEWVMSLIGLAVPPPEPEPWTVPGEPASPPMLAEYAAAQLFRERAQRAYLGFQAEAEREAIGQICRLTEGLPLAIELAAAWVRTIPCQEIARQLQANLDFLTTELRNVPERQRSLRAAFLYSWGLLRPEEQNILKQLTVFQGGFTAAAAATVTAASLRDISALVDKSLLQRTPAGRFDLHPMIHYFALAYLTPAEQTALRTRHSHYFAEQFRLWTFPEEYVYRQEALRRVAEELDNARASWQWACQQPDPKVFDRLFSLLSLFFLRRGRYKEASHLLEEALNALHTVDPAPTLLIAKLQHQLAKHQDGVGNYAGAQTNLDACLPVLTDASTPEFIGDAWDMIGRVRFRLGNLPQAKAAFRQALAWFQRAETTNRIAGAFLHLGMTAKESGRLNEAVTLYQESLSLFREINEPSGMAACLVNLGNLATVQKQAAAAQQYGEEAYTLATQLKDRPQMALAQLTLGHAARIRGEAAAAHTHYETAQQIGERMGGKLIVAVALDGLGQTMMLRGEVAAAKPYLHEALSLAHSLQAETTVLTVLASVGQVAVLTGAEHGPALLAFVREQSGTSFYIKEEIEALQAHHRLDLDAAAFVTLAEWVAWVLQIVKT